MDFSVVYWYAGEGGAEGAVQASVRGHHEAAGQTGERLPSPGLAHTERGTNTIHYHFTTAWLEIIDHEIQQNVDWKDAEFSSSYTDCLCQRL